MEVERILSDLIRIPSVNPPGRETKVAEYLKRLFDGAGIRNEIIESAPGRGSFIATLGEGEKSLLFLSHEDVVPAGEGWDFDPFGGEIRAGLVCGRGALDCKDLVAAEAWAMLQLCKLKLNGKLIFAATADEESGGAYGAKFLLDKHPDKLRADFAINEGGEGPTKIGDRYAYFVQAGEKGSAWAQLKASGISCHGAVPTLGDNAVVKASESIVRLSRYKPRVRIIPEIKGLLDHLGWQREFGKITARNVDALLDAHPDRAFAETLRSLTRMTISTNMVQGGTKTNIVPDSCEAHVDIRVLPGQDREYLLKILRSIVGEDVSIEVPDFNLASFSPTRSPHFRLIETLGDIDCFPMMSAGATDSRFLRAKGIPAYGPAVVARDFDPALKKTYHARNERVDIKSVRLKADFLMKLAVSYLGTA
ncbi:MAG: family metallo-hydrolase [Dehalococcoidia bacterium]|nr:family metallo-hydrolase [Dehalococcoidia bacterium]